MNKFKRTVTMKLNFKLNEPTINERIYSEKCVKDALKKLNIISVVTKVEDNMSINIENILGVVKTYKIENNIVEFEVVPLKDENKILLENNEVTFIGVGDVEKKEVKNFKLLVLGLIQIERKD